MNCVECNRLLGAYLDGELDAPAALAIDEHLQACVQCRRGFARLQATSTALSQHCQPPAAPSALRTAIQAQMEVEARPGWRQRLRAPLLAAVPGVLALMLFGWIALQPAERPAKRAVVADAGTRVVYHVSASDHAAAVLRNVSNHLAADPSVHIVVVAHNFGVDFLLRGATDERGRPFDADVQAFAARGVQFRVCANTLERRQIPLAAVLRDAALVPSGIAEISRLQRREGYVYMRF